MNVLMVGSEAAPFVKTGGLADVLGALPAALARTGESVAVVLPRYRTAALPADPDDAPHLGPAMPIAVGPNLFTIAIEEVTRHNVRYFFVDCPPLYGRAGVYNLAGVDYPDNHIRFAALAQAALAIARWVFPVDVFHAHDWQGGLLGAYLRTRLAHDPTYFGTRTVFTIHNLGYQGLFPASAVRDLGLTPPSSTRRAGVLGSIEFSQSRNRVGRRDHHGQSDLRARNPDPGVRIRPRRRPERPCR